MVAIYPILAVILLIGVKFKGPKNWHDDFLSLETTKAMQGFCAVLIILHHLSQQLTRPPLVNKDLLILTTVGVYCVGIFFFCSGYGLMKSFKTKDNYLKGFLKKRLPSVLIPFYVIVLIFTASSAIVNGSELKVTDYIMLITGLRLANPHTWYIVAIVMFYIAFYLIFKFIKNESIALTVMGVFIAGYTVLGLYLAHGDFTGQQWLRGEWWYNTALVFFVGMVIAKFESSLVPAVKKLYPVYLIGAIVLFAGLFAASLYTLNKYSYWAENPAVNFYGFKEKWICLACQLPSVILFVFAVFLIAMKIQCKGVIVRFLGKISLELYLIHAMFLYGLRSGFTNIKNDLLYIALTIVFSIIAAVILHLIDSALIKLFTKKKAVSNEKILTGSIK